MCPADVAVTHGQATVEQQSVQGLLEPAGETCVILTAPISIPIKGGRERRARGRGRGWTF
jgi:hypothetical protein